jgi:hypothetical protein
VLRWCLPCCCWSGGNSARITALLPPGSYYLIASTVPPYTDVAINGSAIFHTAFPIGLPINRSDSVLTLQARFVDGYTQDCRLKECGFDGRVEDGCGSCPALSHCNATTFKCQPDHCAPNCVNKECGDDGCGGECGRCGVGAGCVKDKFYCLTDSLTCDGLQPLCQQPCQDTDFCASVSHAPDPPLILIHPRLRLIANSCCPLVVWFGCSGLHLPPVGFCSARPDREGVGSVGRTVGCLVQLLCSFV